MNADSNPQSAIVNPQSCRRWQFNARRGAWWRRDARTRVLFVVRSQNGAWHAAHAEDYGRKPPPPLPGWSHRRFTGHAWLTGLRLPSVWLAMRDADQTADLIAEARKLTSRLIGVWP